MKLKDDTTKPFEPGDQVLYIPEHLLMGPRKELVDRKNLGTVTSKNEKFVFVRYIGTKGSQATKPGDLYFIRNRPDLIEILENEDQ